MNETLERLGRRLPAWARWRQARSVLAVAALAVAVLVLAVSCLGGAGGRADVPVVGGEPDAGITGVRAPSDATGGTLRVVAPEIDSLDPQRSYLPGVWNLMRLYTRTLVTYSSEPGRTGELVPDLATDLGTPSEDGLSWTYTLREGVRFENGRPITAQDVKYGIQRSFDAQTVVGGPTYVVDLFDDPANRYPGPYSAEEDDPELTAVETPDERTIVFRLRAPEPDLPYVLALPSSSPVPVEADTGGNYAIDPVSSGPYAITSVDAAVGIQLDRNPEWDPATDDVRTALPDRVLVRTGLSGVERDQALLAGSADVDISGSGAQAPTSARLEGEDGEGLRDRIDDVTTGALRLLALPTDVAPFGNAACRAAVAAAVDRRPVQDALGGAGNAVRTSRLWTRTLGDGSEDADPALDLDAARAHLEECGMPDGFATVLAVPDGRAGVEIAEVVAEQLAVVGIEVEVRPLDAASFYATEVGNPDSVAANEYGIVLATSTPDFPTAGSLLAPLADGRSIRAVGNTNYARLDDPGINGLIDTARTAGTGDAAREAWRAVAAAVEETAAYVPLAETRIQLIAGQRLRNGVVMRPYSGYDLATAGVR
ncbi:ABC transporter substrate-binding protein [Blastococcus goldschmidtiae]|uniref:ABC transporter substrate-binding protein n=1 Tax=Blastococcus goldschmidtiae TaxID=3075546 RepID=A0ABU2KC89_9ACTN|nr:ABC transporter substrate-binding protein [Blastococcus sp. DSM 46792]MDT0277806.1 ABC transporter substrate-binding protein [Blastococcus sp. DSM 46792]